MRAADGPALCRTGQSNFLDALRFVVDGLQTSLERLVGLELETGGERAHRGS